MISSEKVDKNINTNAMSLYRQVITLKPGSCRQDRIYKATFIAFASSHQREIINYPPASDQALSNYNVDYIEEPGLSLPVNYSPKTPKIIIHG